jgi:septum formation topological specificity factor MinE
MHWMRTPRSRKDMLKERIRMFVVEHISTQEFDINEYIENLTEDILSIIEDEVTHAHHY